MCVAGGHEELAVWNRGEVNLMLGGKGPTPDYEEWRENEEVSATSGLIV